MIPRTVFILFTILFSLQNVIGQVTYAEVKQIDYQRTGYGYSVVIETFSGSTPVFFSGGGFIVNSSYQELKGFCSEAMLKLGFGYMDDSRYWGLVAGIKGGGEFDDFNPEIVGYGIGGWGHISFGEIFSMNLEYTYGFNTKSQIYRGSFNVFILSVNFIYLQAEYGTGFYISPGIILRFNTFN